MIISKNDSVKLEGHLHELLVELGVICAAVQEVANNEIKDKNKVGNLILETVAFSLCSEEEQIEVLKSRCDAMERRNVNE